MEDDIVFNIDEGGADVNHRKTSSDHEMHDEVNATPRRSTRRTRNTQPDYSGLDDEAEESFGELEGYADLRSGSAPYENDSNDSDSDPEGGDAGSDSNVLASNTSSLPRSLLGLPRKPKRSYHPIAVRAARRSAIRTQIDQAASFLIDEDGTGDGVDWDPVASRTLGTFGRRGRGGAGYGGAIAGGEDGEEVIVSKKITGDLDSDDDLMITMREKGYTDGQIAERLHRESRAKYDRRSISTRIARIKVAQGAHMDFLIEEGYKEWELADDELLMQAYELANIEVEYEIEKIRAWRFRKVSEYMRRLDKDSIFSEKACRERYQALVNGTAIIPVDEDDDPDARRIKLEKFREERERARGVEAAQKAEKEKRDKKEKEEARMRNAQRAEVVALEREKKQKAKAERAMKRAVQNSLKLQRAQDNRDIKAGRAEQFRKKRAAEKEASQKKVKRMKRSDVMRMSGLEDLKYIDTTTPDPRVRLSIEDLKTLCSQRGLAQTGDSKDVLVQRLKDAESGLGLQQLKTMCRTKGLNTSANKPQLQWQLAMGEASKMPSFATRSPDEVTDQTASEAMDDEDGNEDDGLSFDDGTEA